MTKLVKFLPVGLVSVAFAAPALAYSYSNYATSTAGDAAAGGISLVVWCCICLFVLAYLGLMIYLTMDAFKRDYGTDDNAKVIGLIALWVGNWVFPFVGVILYYFLVMQKFPKKK